jgi:hypothetical protein
MLMTLTIAADNFSRRHHVLMIVGRVADLRGKRFTSEAAIAKLPGLAGAMRQRWR